MKKLIFLFLPLYLVLGNESIKLNCLTEDALISSESCSKIVCEFIENTCTIETGVALLSVESFPNRPIELIEKTKYKLTAAFNSDLQAISEENKAVFHLTKTKINAFIKEADSNAVLDTISIFGYPEDYARSRLSLRLNGKLLRRGSLHYFKDTQKLELYDLNLALIDDWNLELLSFDVAAEQIECPVAYSKRNSDYSIPQSECNTISACYWDTAAGTGCYLNDPLQYGYTVSGPVETTQFGWKIPLEKLGPSIYNGAIQNIVAEIFVYDKDFMRLKIYDPNNQRYEVPMPLNLPTVPFTGQADFEIIYPTINGSPFFIKVNRTSTKTVIFDTSLSGIIFEDQLVSMSIKLPSRNLYGFGENYHGTFRRVFDDTTWPAFSRDAPPNPYIYDNLYGVHPFYEVVEEDGNAHGVLLYNSNAQDFMLQSAAPAVIWRSIGGILDFYIVTGPTPEDVIKEYTNIVGRSFLPPYWAFGFQQSRYGFNTLDNMKSAIQRTIDCQIPLDVFYGDIDTMDLRADFTYDPVNFAGFPQYIDQQRANGMRYVPIVDPAIPDRVNYPTFSRGINSNAYIRAEDGNVLMGNVWPPEPVAFPDFFRSNTSAWWTEEIRQYNQLLRFDGLWIDMNEPANFDTNIPDPGGASRLICSTNPLDDPPYVPKSAIMGNTRRLSDKTLCMNTLQGDGNIYKHYDVHSLYGYTETIPTSQALQAVTGKRGLVFTRSSFVGSGILGGHWTGDNYAYWDHMQYSVIGLLDFNLFGLPYVGADICGFLNDAEERLCQRWQELGAFYPFSRNHNTIGAADQDPCMWPSTVGASTRTAMNIRYRLLPYFYTMFYRANQGLEGTVIRSLLHQYPQDRETYGIDRQFLWGDALLITPVLDIGALTVAGYLPKDYWYDYYTGEFLNSIGQYVIFDAPYDFIPVHVRGGKILPVQRPANTTTYSRQNAFGLVIALDSNLNAAGDFFWDDGETIDTVTKGEYFYSNVQFNSVGNTSRTFSQTIVKPHSTLLQNMFIEDVEIFGLDIRPTSVSGNVGANVAIAYDSQYKKVSLLNAHIPIDIAYTVNLIF